MNKISTFLLFINGYDTDDFELFNLDKEEFNEDLFKDVYDFLDKNSYKVRNEIVDNILRFVQSFTTDK